MAAFSISPAKCDELVSTLNMCVPFLPCLWTTKIAPGSRVFEHTFGGDQFRVTGKISSQLD
jgi:hypothetical protein